MVIPSYTVWATELDPRKTRLHKRLNTCRFIAPPWHFVDVDGLWRRGVRTSRRSLASNLQSTAEQDICRKYMLKTDGLICPRLVGWTSVVAQGGITYRKPL